MDAGTRLAGRVRAAGTPLVLGLDPRPERFPAEFQERGIAGLHAFHEELLDLLAPFVCAVKVQIAFFEVLGEDGLAAYARTCAAARARGLPVIGDVKRGDIGSTAEAYAAAHYRWADWLTLHPWLGRDAVEPFLRYCRAEGKGAFVLVATSNPSWAEFQGLELAGGGRVFEVVADAVARWNRSLGVGPEGLGPVGAVVGATHPELLPRLRARLPASWFLLPGVGAQGGTIESLQPAFRGDGLGALLSISRGLAACFQPHDPDWRARVLAAAKQFRAQVRAALPHIREAAP